MAETHLFQHLAAFVVAFWWTSKWMITRPVSRWRFAMSALAGAIVWIYVAFTALGSVATTGGVTVLIQSQSLAYLAAFMAFVSVVGMILGLFLWTEEEGEKATEGVPDEVLSTLGD